MDNKLIIVDSKDIAPETLKNIEKQVESFIERHKDNRCEINRMVFDAAAALTAGEKLSKDMASQGMLSRFWNRLNGNNNLTQDEINAELITSQQAAQQILQKLAEQNLLSFELIVSVNTKLNVEFSKTNAEINNIYDTMKKFFSKVKEQFVNHEERLKKLEHNDKLQDWLLTVECENFDGVEYIKLDDTTKFVCIVRDFWELTQDTRTPSDFKYLKAALMKFKIDSDTKIFFKDFIHKVIDNEKLYNYLLGENSDFTELATEYEPVILKLKYSKENSERKMLAVQESKISSKPVSKSGDSPQIGSCDLALELIYNLDQVRQAKIFLESQKGVAKND